MTENALPGSQVKRLLSNLSEHSTQHLTEAETDLVQTGILLGEAIEKLGTSFMAIHDAITAQQQAVDMLLSGAEPTLEITELIKAKQQEIGQHVNAAVTGLQFQDMTNQLIGRAVRRVTGLRDVLEQIGAGSAGVSAEGGTEQINMTLNDINRALEEQSLKLESELWKAVCQTHMESGDIELF
ncbi:chemotaxis protein [Noviherbaspirillum cavernae]|uniref:Chemotaxis protein n=1 Tax=Noviherbaspirillum cavernae TaxID=2320862 RepID=A0A418X085_9BURK|nr:chemotaxis protein [Noviherbaspirillum cavernae]RJG05914.1 chemotaxis protein [Noviherbaspirillum cavernae]